MSRNLNTSFLVRQKHGYCFRISVPNDLHPVVELQEIRYSLRTKDYLHAKAIALNLGMQFRRFFADLRQGSEHLSQLTPQDIKRLIKEFIQNELDSAEIQRLQCIHIPPEKLEEIKADYGTLSYHSWQALTHRRYDAASSLAQSLLDDNGLEAENDSHEFRTLCRELLRAVGFVASVNQDREDGVYGTEQERDPDLFKKYLTGDSTAALPAPFVPVEDSPLLSEIIEEYLTETNEGMEWDLKTLHEYQYRLGVFQSFLGDDVPIGTISGPTVRDYKNALKKLPTNFRRGKYKELSIQEVIKQKVEKTLHPTTINNYLGKLRSMFFWAMNNKYINTNPAKGVKVPQSKEQKQRTHFTPKDLKAIFHSPEYKGERPFLHPYMFWAPLIALYTGMRNNEIAQLHVNDFKEIEGIPIIDINEKVTAPKSTDTKKLKRHTNSKRLVPIHPFLAHEIGLMDFVNSLKDKGQIRLFPELNKGRDGHGKEITRSFCGDSGKRGFLEKWGVKKPGSKQEKVFHSFRNTLCHTLQNKGVPEPMGAQITGHSIKGSTYRDYAGEYSLDVVYRDAVLKLDFDRTIGLKHIHFEPK